MLDVEAIEDPAAATVALHPIRSQILSELTTPRSAVALSEQLGLTRQKVNYHLRTLEAHGLAKVAEERTWGGIKERRMLATARSYVISPEAMGPAASDPEQTTDRLSASYLVALAARAVREVAGLARRVRAEGRRLATLSLDAEVRFASPADRAAFTKELGEAVTSLVARYHDGAAANGRVHRLLVFAHPTPEEHP